MPMSDRYKKRPEIMLRQDAPLGVTNTTTETEITGFDIPPGMLRPSRALRVQLQGLYLQNGGALLQSDPLIRVKLGATTVWTSPALWISGLRNISATTRGLWLNLLMSNPGDLSSQVLTIWASVDGLGTGQWSAQSAVNTAQVQRFSLTWQNTRAHISVGCTGLYSVGVIE